MGPAEPAAAPGDLADRITVYLREHPSAALLESGAQLFDFRTARYSVGESHGRCLFQVWSDERNLVRTVLDVEPRAHSLRIVTRVMGQTRPQALELIPSTERRSPGTRDAGRSHYKRLLERVLTRTFPHAKIEALRTAMDLEHSFGPAYIRGRLVTGSAVDAVIGVSQAESSSTIDGILTLGLLWLDYCRTRADVRRHVGGLMLVVPAGSARTTSERLAWLNPKTAAFRLYTLDERTEELVPVELHDTGNLDVHLTHAFSAQSALDRCRSGIDRFLALVPPEHRDQVELRPRSSTEVGLLLHGLEFARVRHLATSHSFAARDELTFGAGPSETPLNLENDSLCRELFARLFAARHPAGLHADPLFRMQPERWLESRLRAHVADLLPSLLPEPIYAQVPAIASGDRGMLDLLALDRAGRLVVLEIKASEDLHLPLQALDYWIRVRALNADRQPVAPGAQPVSAFERSGYFSGASIASQPPRLLLAAPALRLHPANQTVLRFFAPEIEWELLALSEHWRRELRILHRKRSSDPRV